MKAIWVRESRFADAVLRLRRGFTTKEVGEIADKEFPDIPEESIWSIFNSLLSNGLIMGFADSTYEINECHF
jgi:hypothetical protein